MDIPPKIVRKESRMMHVPTINSTKVKASSHRRCRERFEIAILMQISCLTQTASIN
jgi:hypothetical protein